MGHCCDNESDKKTTAGDESEPSFDSSCASSRAPSDEGQDTGDAEVSCCEPKKSFDYLLWVPLAAVCVLYVMHLFGLNASILDVAPVLNTLSLSVYTMMNTMAWGLVVGILMVAILSYVPRELVLSAMGASEGLPGILRATAAGVLLDLCSHGILMVGAKLYERGVSTGQVMAFLIASPWNSFSLTVILIAFIGLSWTLIFIGLSVVIAITTGLLFNILVNRKVLPSNPNRHVLPEGFRFWPALLNEFSRVRFSFSGAKSFVLTGLNESKMVVRWLLIGVLIAALIQAFVTDVHFGQYFGPTVLGLFVTMVAATIIEVCSEGATPIAADIFHRAASPGNSFAFLMAGVSTDYTEIAVLKSRTKSWRIALFLPLLTLPQILVVAFIVNGMVTGL